MLENFYIEFLKISLCTLYNSGIITLILATFYLSLLPVRSNGPNALLHHELINVLMVSFDRLWPRSGDGFSVSIYQNGQAECTSKNNISTHLNSLCIRDTEKFLFACDFYEQFLTITYCRSPVITPKCLP